MTYFLFPWITKFSKRVTLKESAPRAANYSLKEYCRAAFPECESIHLSVAFLMMNHSLSIL